MQKIYILLLYLSICSAGAGVSQSTSREEVLSLFKDTTSIKWIRHYHGLVNSIEQVEISMASDGFNCKGYLSYPKSGTHIELGGNIKGSRLDIRELNEEGLITAYISGVITPEKIEADWQNYNRTIGSKYILFSEIKQTKSTDAINKKWVKWYNGEVAHEKLQLIIFHKEYGILSGFCFNDKGTRMYNVTGTINADKSIFLNFYLDQIEMARFDGKLKGSSLIKGVTNGIGVVNEPLQFELENELTLVEDSYQNFRSSIEILTPDSRNKDFDAYIKQKIQPLIEEINKKVNKSGPSESDLPQPEERLTNRAYIYPDIRFATKELVCGNILYSNTWDKNDKTISFNYDIKKEKEILLEDIWQQKLNMTDTLSKYFTAIGKPGFTYKYFNITPQGLRFFDELDPLYGRKEETIPYAILKKWTRRKSPIRNLINEE